MSQLKTYYHPKDHQILALESEQLAVHLTPGAGARHGHFEGTIGILVANGDEVVTVLWAKEPMVVDVGTYSTGGYKLCPVYGAFDVAKNCGNWTEHPESMIRVDPVRLGLEYLKFVEFAKNVTKHYEEEPPA